MCHNDKSQSEVFMMTNDNTFNLRIMCKHVIMWFKINECFSCNNKIIKTKCDNEVCTNYILTYKGLENCTYNVSAKFLLNMFL